MILLAILLVLCLLVGAGIATTAWVSSRVEAAHPPRGTFVQVDGGQLHVLERPARGAAEATIVFIHGASSNAADLMTSLGPRLPVSYRLIALDRPGHGWSDRPGGASDAAPDRQASLIAQALREMGAEQSIIVGHSLAGAAATNMALDQKDVVAGLVLLGAVTHPWPGGIAWYYHFASPPVLGRLFSWVIGVPAASMVIESAVDGVFAPQESPKTYLEEAQIRLLLRPHVFQANAQDVSALLDFVTRQSPRYPQIEVPTAIITGDRDTTVSPTIHSATIARQIEDAKLTVLQGVGHLPQYAQPDLIAAEIMRVAGESR